MRTIMLIGGMGSGKSTVSRMLEERGAFCIDLDREGHEVLGDPSVVSQLTDAFGRGILAEGAISKLLLAEAAFATPEATRRLSEITHPAIVKRAREALAAAQAQGLACAVVEASAYAGPGGFFDPLADRCDRIVAVVAPVELRVARAVSKGFDEADVRSRIARQPDDAERVLWADEVIENAEGLSELAARVDAIWEDLAEGDRQRARRN